MNNKRVAIIGSGPSGLTSAKCAVENGLLPVVFEKTKFIGGLWAPNTAIWDGMFTNVSYYTMTFSDFPWSQNTPIFPRSDQVYVYLNNYVEHFKLTEYIRLETIVENVRQESDKKWKIIFTSLNEKIQKTEIFDFLVIASGMESKAMIPDISSLSQYKGIIRHSSMFRLNDQILKLKKVAVVGCSYSATEIASYLGNHSESVYNIFRRPYYISSRLIPVQTKPCCYRILPHDFYFYTRELSYSGNFLSISQQKENLIKFLEQTFPKQTCKYKSHPELYIDPKEFSYLDNIPLTISDDYHNLVEKGKIEPIKTCIKYFDETGIFLENGKYLEVDVVIFCTGYQLENKYFEEELLKKLNFKEGDKQFPYLLYKGTFCTEVDNLAFICQTDELFFTGSELQAKWAMKVFSGVLELPNRNHMLKEIQVLANKRDSKINEEPFYCSYVYQLDNLAAELNAVPGLIKEDPKIFEMYSKNLLISTQFIWDEKRILALQLMNEICQITNQIYELNEEELNDPRKIGEKFSQFFKLNLNVFDPTNLKDTIFI